MLADLVGKLLGRDPNEVYVGIDVGASTTKLVELDLSGEKPILKNIGEVQTPLGALKNNMIVKPEELAIAIRTVLDNSGFASTKAVIALPGPSVFTKKITTGITSLKELKNTIQFEAANYIPHNISAVALDYQVLRTIDDAMMEVFLVAVKNEILDSYIQMLEIAGLDPTIVDVDFFALENLFELTYPDSKDKTVAIINIGNQYSTVNIVANGESVFTGDVSVGGKMYTANLAEALEINQVDAEQAKKGELPEGVNENMVAESIDRTTEHIATELHRQLGFFWNAAATDKEIEAIYITGGSSLVPGLREELSAKTGMVCHEIEPFKNIECPERFDGDYLSELGPVMAVSTGLALRRTGDKANAIE